MVTLRRKSIAVSRKAVWALCLVILLPLVSYYWVSNASEDAVAMPRRLYVDTVINTVKNGKSISDTVWHKTADITLTNQLGKQVSLHDVDGKIVVADFFFTHCPYICPTLTRNMKKLQLTLRGRDETRVIDTSFVQFMSFTVDPEHDSVPVLKRYADAYGINHDSWWLLTGPKNIIYNFSLNEMKLGLQDTEVDSNFVHSQKMVLLDKDHVVRGYYNGLDSADILRLAQDIIFLQLEKDRKKPSPVFAEMKQIWPVYIVVAIVIIVFVILTRRRKDPLQTS